MKAYDVFSVLIYAVFLLFGIFSNEPLWVIAAVLFDAVDALRCIAKKDEKGR